MPFCLANSSQYITNCSIVCNLKYVNIKHTEKKEKKKKLNWESRRRYSSNHSRKKKYINYVKYFELQVFELQIYIFYQLR